MLHTSIASSGGRGWTRSRSGMGLSRRGLRFFSKYSTGVGSRSLSLLLVSLDASSIAVVAGAADSDCTTAVFALCRSPIFEAAARVPCLPRAAREALCAASVLRDFFTFSVTSTTGGSTISNPVNTKYSGARSPSSVKSDAMCPVAAKESSCANDFVSTAGQTR
jgi:hypothetical protein